MLTLEFDTWIVDVVISGWSLDWEVHYLYHHERNNEKGIHRYVCLKTCIVIIVTERDSASHI